MIEVDSSNILTKLTSQSRVILLQQRLASTSFYNKTVRLLLLGGKQPYSTVRIGGYRYMMTEPSPSATIRRSYLGLVNDLCNLIVVILAIYGTGLRLFLVAVEQKVSN
jgi:hypothetical protein